MNRSRTEYTQRINRTMDYTDSPLAEPLPLAKLAAVAAFSRAFRQVHGISASGYRAHRADLTMMDRNVSIPVRKDGTATTRAYYTIQGAEICLDFR